MLNNFIKISFALIGGITGFTIAKFTLIFIVADNLGLQLAIYLISILLFSVIFYYLSTILVSNILNILENAESFIQRMSLYEILVCAAGLIVGLIVANLVVIPITRVSLIGIPVSIASNILFGYIGVYISIGKRSEVLNDISSMKEKSIHPKIVDTCVLIDGRIVDIIRSGFLEGPIIVPEFILSELRHIADSSDTIKRNKGRRGLDILKLIGDESLCAIKIDNENLPKDYEVDLGLIKIAKKYKAKIITTDYNLNKVAELQNISVLNVNELSNAVKPIAFAGEKMEVKLVKDGKENGQAIAYMEDGTMIVVEGGQAYIGMKIVVVVTSVLQTSAGRMVFAKTQLTAEKIV